MGELGRSSLLTKVRGPFETRLDLRSCGPHPEGVDGKAYQLNHEGRSREKVDTTLGLRSPNSPVYPTRRSAKQRWTIN